MNYLKQLKWVIIVVLTILTSVCYAAPYNGDTFTYHQPDGSTFPIKLFGDEYYAVAETLDGHVVVKDQKTNFYCYGELSADGNSFISTGIPVATSEVNTNKQPRARRQNVTARLKKHARINPGQQRKLITLARKRMGVDEKGRSLKHLKHKARTPNSSDPMASGGEEEPAGAEQAGEPLSISPTVGKRVGLTLLVQFPDRASDVTITQQQIDDFSNDPNYTGFGNATSIYGYFKKQSNGKLEYNNNVTAYFTAAHNRGYYTDETVYMGLRAKELIEEGLEVLKAQGFDFTKCDGDNDGVIDGISILYAGDCVNGWLQGLWPHKWESSWAGFAEHSMSSDFQYQTTNIGDSLSIGTVCHENGHMICDLPDLYSYNGNAANVGQYSLMGVAGGKHPPSFDAYLKSYAGWATIIDVDSTSQLRGVVRVDQNTFYRYRNPTNPQEYFLISMRDDSGYEGVYGGSTDPSNPSDGLVVLHVLESGSNTHSSIVRGDNPADYSTPYELMVVEAAPDLINSPWYQYPSPGSNDSFYYGYVDHISNTTFPELRFWSSTGRTVDSDMVIHSISSQGDSISFVIGSGDPAGSPAIGTTRNSLTVTCDYSTTAAAQDFAIINGGGGTLNYTLSANAAWLSLDVTNGTSTDEFDVINVTFDTSALTAGTYTADITISDDDAVLAPTTIPVNLTVYAQPTIFLDKTDITVDLSPERTLQKQLKITNSSEGTLEYTLTSNASWLTLATTSGSVSSEEDIIDLTINSTGLAVGTYATTIDIDSSNATNAPQTVAVTLTVIPLSVSTNTLIADCYQGKNPDQQTFTIKSHEGTVAYDLQESVNWLTLSPTTGSSSGEEDTITVTYNAAGLNPGTYTTVITNQTPPLAIDVQLNVYPPELFPKDGVVSADWQQSAGADGGWEVNDTFFSEGRVSLKSADIGDNQSAAIECTRDFTAGIITFKYKISSEKDYDFLRFYIDGIGIEAWSGNHNWTEVRYPISAGRHTLKWVYAKDYGVAHNTDSAWIDELTMPVAGTPHNLSVTNGSGSGSYISGSDITITADIEAQPLGQAFDGWIGDTSGIANVSSASTTLTMPTADVNITATYRSVPIYTLTVTDGSGDCSYIAGTDVAIAADAPPTGKIFDQWVGDVAGIADVEAAQTILTTQSGNAVIAATYTDAYTLTVNSGGGDGQYKAGAVVTLTANPAWADQGFSSWMGDTATVVDTISPVTTLTMPAADTTVTARFLQGGYQLTVTGGQGSGRYMSNTHVPVIADAASGGLPTGFDQWTGDTAGLAEVTADSTILTMPSAAATITATYLSAPTHTLTVNSGSGDGDYTANVQVPISADAAPAGKEFDQWIGDTQCIASVTAVSTTVTMMASAVNVTATYKDLPITYYTLSVNSGSGDGNYQAGEVVAISADAAPVDQEFDQWTGDTTGIADVNAATTTITMPAAYATITATYKDLYSSSLEIEMESAAGQANFAPFEVVSDIAASSGSYIVWPDNGDQINSTPENADNGQAVYNFTLSETTDLNVQIQMIAEDSADDSFYYKLDDGAWQTQNGAQFMNWGMKDLMTFTAVSAGSHTITVLVREDNTKLDKLLLRTVQGNVTVPAVTYALTVNSGSGDGSYPAGTAVGITADAAPANQEFDQWTGDTTGIADVNAAATTITMPAADVTVTATYKDLYSSSLEIEMESAAGQANFAPFEVVGDVTASNGSYIVWPHSGGQINTTPENSDTGQAVYNFTLSEATDLNLQIQMIAENNADDSFYYKLDDGTWRTQNDAQFMNWTMKDLMTFTDVSAGSHTITFLVREDNTKLDKLLLQTVQGSVTVPAVTYVLTVNSGSGDGSYQAGTAVGITADTAPVGKEFDQWTGDTTGIADVNAATTTIVMPAADATVTATYKDLPTYTLSINSGSGDGDYQAGTVVGITADTAPVGKEFDQWTGDTTGIADVNAATTTITMPAAAATVTATYKDLPTYTLSVNSGSGDGDYQDGAVVGITADAAPAGKEFDQWTGDTTGIADVNAATTTITMSAANATITATYKDLPVQTYTLTVSSGSGDGSYQAGEVVTITADAPPSGRVFKNWTGDTTGIADVNAATTTITMPSSDVNITATYKGGRN